MIRQIITYPTPPSVAYATDVRVMSEEIISLLEDLKDTIEANKLDGLSAFQIGSYYNIVVIKNDDDSFLELINPRLFSHSGSITTQETTAYFPNLSAKVTRFKEIVIVYEDRELKQHSIKADGAKSILLQRKIDFSYGSSFLNKLDKEEKKLFKKKLEFGGDIAISEVCPTTFKRDYILKVINYILIAMLLVLGSALFVKTELFKYQTYLFLSAFVLNVIYFFYAQYEGKRFTSCTSCQIGNIIGTTVIMFAKMIVLYIISYLVL